MKRQYVTPVIVTENFGAALNIANCAIRIGYMNNSCVVNDPDTPEELRGYAQVIPAFFVGTGTEGGCTQDAVNMPSTDGICYHTSVQALFNS